MSNLNKLVVAFTMPDPKGVNFMGIQVGIYDCPTALIERKDGTLSAWALHLTREATPEEEISYWKNRALKAERKVG